MMNRLSLAAIASLSIISVPCLAQAPDDSCSAETSARPVDWGRLPLSNASLVQPVNIVVSSHGRCDLQIVFDRSAFALNGPNGSIDASLMERPNTFIDGPLSSSVTGRGSTLFWRPTPSGTVPAGSFSSSLPYSVVDRASLEIVATGAVDFLLDVDGKLSVSVRGRAGRGMDVDLGNIKTGARNETVFDVSSNSSFSVSAESASGGFLVHDLADIKLPYIFSINHSGLTGSADGRSFDAGSGEVSVDVRVPAVPNAPAGTYHDELTIIFRSEL